MYNQEVTGSSHLRSLQWPSWMFLVSTAMLMLIQIHSLLQITLSHKYSVHIFIIYLSTLLPLCCLPVCSVFTDHSLWGIAKEVYTLQANAVQTLTVIMRTNSTTSITRCSSILVSTKHYITSSQGEKAASCPAMAPPSRASMFSC